MDCLSKIGFKKSGSDFGASIKIGLNIFVYRPNIAREKFPGTKQIVISARQPFQ